MQRICKRSAFLALPLALWYCAAAGDGADYYPRAPDDVPGVDPAAYARMLEENLSLRRRMEALAESGQAGQARSVELESRVDELTRKIEKAAAELAALRADHAAASSETRDLQRRVSVAEDQRQQALDELERVRERERRLLARRDAQAAAQPAAATPRTGAEAVSDLIRERDRENARLRGELDETRATHERTLDQRDAALSLLEEAMARLDAESRAHTRLQNESAAGLKELEQSSEREIQDLSLQLQAREALIASLQRTVARLERERERASAASAAATAPSRPAAAAAAPLPRTEDEASRLAPEERRRRDLHYNKGVLHASAGRWADAEVEYRAALRIDPRDAGTHYNLGLLYHENLDKPARAIEHYGAFLAQRPHAPQSAVVRSWLMELKMRR